MKQRWSIRSLMSRVRARLNLAFIDRSTDAATTFLISSGRSGSTWLTSLLRSVHGTRVIFEPFHPGRGVASLTKARYTYLSPEVEHPDIQGPLRAILDGTSCSVWTEHLNDISNLVYQRRLVKLVRATLMLPWLARQFQTCRFIYLVRHPAAVVLSQLHGGWDLTPQRLFEQPDLRSAIDLDKYSQFGWPESGFDANLVFWAIENQVAAEFARQADCLIVRYEDICMNPQAELSRLQDFLGISFPGDLQAVLSTSSWSSERNVGERSVDHKVNSWHARTTESQRDLVSKVLAQSVLSQIYPDAHLPFATAESI